MYHTWMRFFTPGPAHHRLGLVCLGVGLQYGALPTVGPRVLDHHVAVVISTGAGWYAAPDGRRTTVTAPALLWLTPGVPHHYAPDPGTGWDEGFVDFTGPAAQTYTELGYIEPGRPVVPLSDAAGPRAVIGRIARAARRDNPCWRWRPAPPSTSSSSPCAAPAPTSPPTATRSSRPSHATRACRSRSPTTPPGTA